jgi:type II secretory ATPase GspE/PulE/Tfp pilus assembly ATPase PilB-like protein
LTQNYLTNSEPRRASVTDESLVYLTRGFPNLFSFNVNEINLEEIAAASLKDSVFGCRLEVETKSGEKISVGSLSRDEAIAMADILSESPQDSTCGPEDGAVDIRAQLPEIQPRIDEICSDRENYISRLVDLVIEKAVELRASDIHFEPLESLAIRYRIDGVLIDIAEIPSGHHDRIAARIKVLAKLPSYEKDVPLDGRIEKDYGEGLDLRVSTFPTVRGDKVVIRIFDSQSHLFGLEELGLGEDVLSRFKSLIMRPEGTIILTGPSNSGKTTTIYSALESIYDVKRNTVNIATIEDPVERDLRKFSQTQIAPTRGLTFHSALRSLLRQDPDVIVVGEIRDAETANTAIRAGMTGHLVVTTIHSGTAPGVLARLMEMGLEPFILASSITGILAQRLVRKVCTGCSDRSSPPTALLQQFGIDDAVSEQSVGRGCSGCGGTGYRGRTVISELLVMDDALREAVLARSPVNDLKRIAGDSGMRDLLFDGLDKINAGVTNLEELARVIIPNEG